MQRATYAAHQLPPGVPAAFLSLGQIIALVEKRLRWYGFSDWRITDVVCEREQSVAVEIRNRQGIVMTISLARDCAAPEYGVHAPEALVRPAPTSAAARPQPTRKPVGSAHPPGTPEETFTHLSAVTPKARRPLQSRLSGYSG